MGYLDDDSMRFAVEYDAVANVVEVTLTQEQAVLLMLAASGGRNPADRALLEDFSERLRNALFPETADGG